MGGRVVTAALPLVPFTYMPAKKPLTVGDYNPAKNYFLVKPEMESEKSEGGIIIPEQARHMLNEGEVLKCGPECGSDIVPGMFITWAGNSEYKLDIEGATVIAVQESNVILTRQQQKELFGA